LPVEALSSRGRDRHGLLQELDNRLVVREWRIGSKVLDEDTVFQSTKTAEPYACRELRSPAFRHWPRIDQPDRLRSTFHVILLSTENIRGRHLLARNVNAILNLVIVLEQPLAN
jgi:hypothetical protein